MYSEGVEVGIVGRFVPRGHKVDGVSGRGKEEELEDSVVQGVGESPEEVEIARDVDYKVECL